jgi:hypothetical protein
MESAKYAFYHAFSKVGTIPVDSLHYIVVYYVFPVEAHLAISFKQNNIYNVKYVISSASAGFLN